MEEARLMVERQLIMGRIERTMGEHSQALALLKSEVDQLNREVDKLNEKVDSLMYGTSAYQQAQADDVKALKGKMQMLDLERASSDSALNTVGWMLIVIPCVPLWIYAFK